METSRSPRAEEISRQLTHAQVILLATALLLFACGDDDSSGKSAPTSTPTPPTFARAFLEHLGRGLDDPPLASELIERLGATTIDALEEAVDGDVGDPLLALLPPTVAAEQIDSIVVFAFGNRIDADGNITPGPMNEDLATAVELFLKGRRLPVYAQWEVADILIERGLPNVVSIGVVIGDNGQEIYLSTAGVAEQAVELAASDGIDLGQVGVIAFADHAVRTVLTARAAGMAANVPRGLTLPSSYDPDSGQPWTRDRLSYLSVDFPARLLFAR